MITLIDFYKAGHREQYPLGTELVMQNLTPRSNKILLRDYPEHDGKVVVLMQHVFQQLIDKWDREFFDRPLEEVLTKYKRRIDCSLGKGAITFDHIIALHELGHLPIHVLALPDGTLADVGTPIYILWNYTNQAEFFWVPNYLETQISAMSWHPMTNATIAREYRKLMQRFADLTCDNDAHLGIQCHDFSARGLDDEYQRPSIGHLTQFIGTDSVAAIDHIEDHYNQLATETNPIGVSVPATEHSVMCMGGKETELETFVRLNSLYPSGIVSIVSDTWDYWKVLTEILPAMKGQILARQDITDADGNVLVPGRLVVRPDSGDPVKIITGYTEDEFYKQDGKLYCRETGNELTKEEVLGSIEVLGDIFGFTENEKGYRMLDSHIGLIYGDSITYARAKEILERLERMGWASSNVVFGIGSYTYQYVTRDNLGFAVKATYGVIDGVETAIQKDPKTDSGTKKSLKGIPVVLDGKTYTFDSVDDAESFAVDKGTDYITLVDEGSMQEWVNWDQVCSSARA